MSLDNFRAQNGEDVFLGHLFPADFRGTFVEAGALDGERLSNTYHLEQSRGWHGLLVEPIEELAAACMIARPASTTVCAALGSAPGFVELTVPDDPAFASTLGGNFLARRHTNEGATTRRVPVVTLDELLERAGFTTVDLLVLDVEGAELSALRGISLDRWRPDVIVIERDALVARIFWILATSGYTQAARIGHNDLWLRDGGRGARRHLPYLRTVAGPTLRGMVRASLARLHLLGPVRSVRSRVVRSQA